MQDNSSGICIADLPDDIVSNILCRLPAESVLVCKQVCSHWFYLSSTPYFAKKHFAHVTPILMGQERDIAMRRFMFLLQDFEKNPKVTKTRLEGFQYCFLTLKGSYNGFLLFEFVKSDKFMIYNPLTRETCRIFFKDRRHRIVGFYFHQLEEDYKLLLCDERRSNYYYYTYSLSTKHMKELRSSPYAPYLCSQYEFGVLVCGALFWIVYYRKDEKHFHLHGECLKSIMMFDLATENFHVMPHPGSICTRKFYRWITYVHEQMRLLEVDNKLNLANLCEKTIEVWVLEDVGNWMWVKRYVINIGHRFDRFEPYNHHPVVAIQSGKLLLNCPCKGLIYYDLRLNMFRKLKGSYVALKESDFFVTKFSNNFVSNVFSESLETSRYIS